MWDQKHKQDFHGLMPNHVLERTWEFSVKLMLYLHFLSHIEKITTWQDPRKTMNQPLNHMSHHPAATSTPVPQRSMAMSQPNLGEYWISFLWWKYEQEGRAIFY